jgi:putative spermidine/putrescine transport system substrate-binding protein
MIAELPSPTIDSYQFLGGEEIEAKKRGLTQHVGDLGGVKLPPVFVDPDHQWVAVAAVPSGILYNTKFIKTPPTSVKDFLRPEYRGKVALAEFSNIKGVDFMLMLARAFGGSEQNAEPGMAKLEELIRGGAKIFSTAAQLKALFAQDEVWIAYYDVAKARSAADQGLPVGFVPPAEGMTVQLVTTIIAKNSKNADAARKAIAYALRPESQRKFAEVLGWSPVNPNVTLPPELAAMIPVGEDAYKKYVVLNRALIGEKRPDWIDQFNRITTQTK